jgi:hypothetical protein
VRLYEGHRGRLVETEGHLAHGQIRIEHGRSDERQERLCRRRHYKPEDENRGTDTLIEHPLSHSSAATGVMFPVPGAATLVFC